MMLGTLLIVDPGLKLWGSERALLSTLEALSTAWKRVVLVTPPGSELADELGGAARRYGSVEVMHAPIGLLHKLGWFHRLHAAFALTRLAASLRPDRIYINQAGIARLLLPAARLLGVPLVVHVRLREDLERSLSIRGTTRTSVDLIVVSEAMLEWRPPTVASHRAVRAVYDPYPIREDVSAQIRSDSAPFVSVGRLSHGKGVHLLVEALAHPDLSHVRADVYGAGVPHDGYAAALEEQASALSGRIRFLGFRRDVKQHLPGYRFLVLTSHYEPLGRVVIEAWVQGLVPIVFAGSGGAAEIVKKSAGGLVFTHWTAESLRVMLQAALEIPEEDCDSMVAAGRSWVRQNLTIDVYTRALSGVLF